MKLAFWKTSPTSIPPELRAFYPAARRSPRQRLGLGLVGLIVVIGLIWLGVWLGQSWSSQPISDKSTINQKVIQSPQTTNLPATPTPQTSVSN